MVVTIARRTGSLPWPTRLWTMSDVSIHLSWVHLHHGRICCQLFDKKGKEKDRYIRLQAYWIYENGSNPNWRFWMDGLLYAIWLFCATLTWTFTNCDILDEQRYIQTFSKTDNFVLSLVLNVCPMKCDVRMHTS